MFSTCMSSCAIGLSSFARTALVAWAAAPAAFEGPSEPIANGCAVAADKFNAIAKMASFFFVLDPATLSVPIHILERITILLRLLQLELGVIPVSVNLVVVKLRSGIEVSIFE